MLGKLLLQINKAIRFAAGFETSVSSKDKVMIKSFSKGNPQKTTLASLLEFASRF
jgi:hypothetical protein